MPFTKFHGISCRQFPFPLSDPVPELCNLGRILSPWDGEDSIDLTRQGALVEIFYIMFLSSKFMHKKKLLPNDPTFFKHL